MNRISSLRLFEGKTANHVLVNEYLSGQGIMPHEDGPLFFPCISTISLASHTVLTLQSKKGHQVTDRQLQTSLLLEPRSLLVMRDDAYTSYLHGIDPVTQDVLTHASIANLSRCPGRQEGDVVQRTRRVSCTIRYVNNMRMDLMQLLRK